MTSIKKYKCNRIIYTKKLINIPVIDGLTLKALPMYFCDMTKTSFNILLRHFLLVTTLNINFKPFYASIQKF